MKAKFSLRKSSKIYLLISIILSIVTPIMLMINDSIASSQGIRVLVVISTSMIFPVIISWIVWLLSARKKYAGDISFKIILSFLLIGNLSNTTKQIKEYKEKKFITYLDEFRVNKSKHKKSALNSKSSKIFDLNFKKYQSSSLIYLDKISKLVNKEEKKAIKIFKKSLKKILKETDIWNKSVEELSSERILNYSLLKRDKEFTYQYKIVKNYIIKARNHKKNVTSFPKELEQKLYDSGINKDGKFMKSFKEKIINKASKKNPLFEVLMNEHIKYGNNLIILLSHLEKNLKIWNYKNNKIIINDTKVSKEYYRIIEKISINEDNISSLSKDYLEAI